MDPTSAIQAALRAGHLSEDAPAVIFHDLDQMRARLARVAAAFPPGALHAVAIKANPLVEVLRALIEAGAGLEAASWEEVRLALAAGCPPSRVVYDSPAKTRAEIDAALRAGVHLNADNLAELQRISELRAGSPSTIGLRVNPQVGAGRIGLTSVADKVSKFGVPIDDPALPEALRLPWVTGLHVHVGSQGCTPAQLAEGVRRVWALRTPHTTTFDIGGGLPVPYREGEPAPTPEEYAALLPDFSASTSQGPPGRGSRADAGGVRLVTEFGRFVQAPCGWAVSRVEYVKRAGEVAIAVLHVGGDLLVRAILRPDEWYHGLAVLDPEGRPKAGAPGGRWMVAGPLCFGGDVLARDLALPPVEPGDLVVVRDVGAYTLSYWSRSCSRAIPAVLGIDGDALRVLRPRERPDDLVTFWGAGASRP